MMFADHRPGSGWRPAPWLLTVAASLLCVVLAGCGQQPAPVRGPSTTPSATVEPPGLQRARANLGESRSGLPWLSGVWPGGDTITGSRADAFGAWRGTPADAATTYPASKTWQTIHDSTWHITTYDGFAGVLSYGLPMLPRRRRR